MAEPREIRRGDYLTDEKRLVQVLHEAENGGYYVEDASAKTSHMVIVLDPKQLRPWRVVRPA